MNDIWALPSGEWVVYTDEEDIIKDFLTLADLKVVTSYHGILKRHRAMQFSFPDEENVLRYICYVSGFNYDKAVKLNRRPGIGYNYSYGGAVHQPPLFMDVNPRRKGSDRRPR